MFMIVPQYEQPKVDVLPNPRMFRGAEHDGQVTVFTLSINAPALKSS